MVRSSSKLTILAVAAAAVAVALPLPIRAQEREEYPNELGFQFGLSSPDKDLVSPDQSNPIGLAGAVRYGHMLGEHPALFVDGIYAGYNGGASMPDSGMSAARVGVEWLFNPWRKWRWTVEAGVGWMEIHFNKQALENAGRVLGSVGFGQRRHMSGRQYFRWTIRGDYGNGNSGLDGKDIINVHALIGFGWGFGGPPKDSDGDGVPDRKDKCPDTPRGARVDEKGCPFDTDGDGVFDGLDRCPDTPKGWKVDASGCPVDSDGDGVPDGGDACPNTPKGAKVDTKGCPVDTDGDGVYDGIDQCPNTLKGCKVDAKGCPLDSDGDGVCDGIDQCPDTPKGVKVDAKGCTIAEAKPAPAPVFSEAQRELILQGVTFENNSAKLTTEATFVLDKIAYSLDYYKDVKVEIDGYTDSRGSDAYNQKLSEARAKSVYDYIVGKGIPASRLSYKGFGEKNPIADNKTDAGRAKNRRVALKKL